MYREDDDMEKQQDKTIDYRDATKEEVDKALDRVFDRHDELFKKLAQS